MGKYRKRFNEKARSGMVAKQEKLRRARQKSFRVEENDGRQTEEERVRQEQEEENFNPNAEVLMPMTTEEKLDRKRKLQESLPPPQEAPISRTKRKRLEKYIVSFS